MFRIEENRFFNYSYDVFSSKQKNEKQTVQSHQEQAFSLELNSSIQEKNSLYDRPLKELFQEAKEASENALKEYREEMYYNKETGKYEKKFTESNEKYKEKIKGKIEEQIKENIQSSLQDKISHINIQLSSKQLIAQVQFEEKQKATLNTSDVFM
ncbi:hypothetical protein [Campylobacter lari]|uniref:hypothetical protein n=1 Tax=Campylobacter lari TaxID=201 RepID=UPI000B4054A5|nr:hypothetical protein [Campylobacter lari]MCR6511325.1 hypothetical protein [Campylobacter lari]MCR6528015.1 hypothetical protein [Campylobacter lari]MCR6557678.1 hypothetical protein [Campylobacter lari]